MGVQSTEVPVPIQADPKKPRVKPSHPPTSEMVLAAIKNSKERGGSSLQAIKKYITATYNVEVEKHSPFIRKYLRNSVENSILIQTKGKGASGSFKLNSAKFKAKTTKSNVASPIETKKPAVKKPAAEKELKAGNKADVATKKPAVKKAVSAKKEAKQSTPSKPVSKSISKKTARSLTTKPKTPKLKMKASAKAKSKK